MTRHQWLFVYGAFLHTSTTLKDNLYLSANLQASLDGGIPGWQSLGITQHVPTSLTLTLFWQRQSPAAAQGHNYWASLGYRPIGLPLSTPLLLPRTVTVQSIDLSWQTGTNWRFTINSGVRRHLGSVLSHYRLRYDPHTTGLQASTIPAISASGTVLTVGGQLNAQLSGSFSIEASGHYAYVTSSSETIYRNAWRTRSLALLKARFTPNQRFSLYGALRYRGTAFWPEYLAAEIEAPSYYDATLPSAAASDFTIQKRLWGERLRVSASLRNLFSGPYRTHPAGAPSRLLFLVRMQYAFTDSEE